MCCNRVFTYFFILFPYILLGQVNGCPEVSITDINENQTIYMNCNTDTGCVDLVANYPETGTPTSYTIEAIDYAPTFPYSGLANPISVNTDDVWSDPKVTLPFNFCFYNQEYSEAVVSSNGAISFNSNLINDNGFNDAADECAWEFNLSIPNAQFPSTAEPKKILNAIFGVFHDIDPSQGGQIGWELFGNYPCRRLVVSYYQVPLYDCLSVNSTFQMVLFESTNIIEIYIEKKSTCNDWNNGNSLIGIQNASGTQGATPPNRNTGNWTTENEAWRITPTGPSNTQITWYDDVTGTILATNQDQITVCPTANHNYRAEVIYTLCDGSSIVTSDYTTVEFTNIVFSVPPVEHFVCDNDTNPDGQTTIDLSVFEEELITELNSINPHAISFHYTEQDAIDNVGSIPIPTSFINNTNPETVYGRIEDLTENCILIKQININVISEPDFFDAEVISENFADTHQILATVSGNGSYLFSIDDGAFQTSGLFTNVTSGQHTITIIDSNRCFIKQLNVIAVSYPKFFTPNGDGVNDYWNIAAKNKFAFISITIVDRFGKEIIKLDENSLGWDGTYNGNPLPASDYWFIIEYIDKQPKGQKREFIAHFALKR